MIRLAFSSPKLPRPARTRWPAPASSPGPRPTLLRTPHHPVVCKPRRYLHVGWLAAILALAGICKTRRSGMRRLAETSRPVHNYARSAPPLKTGGSGAQDWAPCPAPLRGHLATAPHGRPRARPARAAPREPGHDVAIRRADPDRGRGEVSPSLAARPLARLPRYHAYSAQ